MCVHYIFPSLVKQYKIEKKSSDLLKNIKWLHHKNARNEINEVFLVFIICLQEF